MSRLVSWLAVAAAAGLAWWAWHPPAPPDVSVVRVPIPPGARQAPAHWRVVTHRFVWKKGAEAMRARLQALGFAPIVIVREEIVEVHAFDDPRLFASEKEARKAAAAWRKKGVDAVAVEVRAPQGKRAYRVALGRFYLDAYAREQAKRLAATGLAYRYERRAMRLPTWRFATQPLARAEAEAVFRALAAAGLGEPRLLREDEFQRLFGAALAHEGAGG